MSKKKHIVCIGIGAVGSLYMSHLCPQHVEVTAWARSDAEHIKSNGINIRHPNQSVTHWVPNAVITKPDQVKQVPDYIVVCTKVESKSCVLDQVDSLLGPQTSIVLIQNGLFIEEPYVFRFPDTPIISGLAFVCVVKTRPGQIHHQDYGRLAIGPVTPKSFEQTQQFAALFNKSPIACHSRFHIQEDRYKKIMWNAAFNPLSILSGERTTRQILANPESKKQVIEIMKEVQRVAQADGYTIPDTIISKHLADTESMRPYKTSMLVDWQNNRPLEIEAILGNMIRHARKKQIKIPHCEQMYQSVITKLKEKKS